MWFFEVYVYYQEQCICYFGCECFEVVGVFVGGFDVVDGVGVDYYEQMVVFVIQDVVYYLVIMGYGLQGFVGQGNFMFELFWCDQGFVGGNVKVVDL